MPVDPKNYQPKKDEPEQADMASLLTQMAQMQQETARLLLEMRQSGATANAGAIERLLDQQEKLLVKTRPENTEHPGISVFSHPEGELARPKAQLKCPFTWCGADETWETLTPDEVEWRNRLVEVVEQKGALEGFVTKANGDRIKFTATPKRTDAGTVEHMTVHYKCKDEHKADHMHNVAYLRQVLGEAIPSTGDLMAELTRLRAELDMAKAGAARV